MDALQIKQALSTIVAAAPLDIKFSTKISKVKDGIEEDEVYFLLMPITGELVEDGGLYRTFNIDCGLYQKMDEETDEDERDNSISMLESNISSIFQEFYMRHVQNDISINGLPLSVTLTTSPEILVDWDQVPNNENLVGLKFSIQDEKPINCATTSSLFSYV